VLKKLIFIVCSFVLFAACGKQVVSPAKQVRLNERLFAAIDQSDWGEMKKLLAAGADINAVRVPPCEGGACGEGQTPLMTVSSYYHSEETVRFLLDNGADVNAQGQYGQTALMKAAEGCRVGNVRLLLTAGADVNARNDVSETALMYAASHDCADVISVLLQAEADIHATDKDGETALSIAELRANTASAEVLKAAGGK